MDNIYFEIIISLMLILFKVGSGLNLTGILVPRYRLEGEDASLECQYQLSERSLYAVKWYKSDEEFFKWVQRAVPPATPYPVEGVNVDVGRSDRRRVYLRKVSPLSSGVYRCEVSAEAPSFSSATASARMTVQHLPESGPEISGGKDSYSLGEEVSLNCTSGLSYPASVLHWYVNDIPVKSEEQGLVPYPTVREEGGLLRSHLGLSLQLRKYHLRGGGSGQAELRCSAGYPLPPPPPPQQTPRGGGGGGVPEGEALTAGLSHHRRQPVLQPWEAVWIVTVNGSPKLISSSCLPIAFILAFIAALRSNK